MGKLLYHCGSLLLKGRRNSYSRNKIIKYMYRNQRRSRHEQHLSHFIYNWAFWHYERRAKESILHVITFEKVPPSELTLPEDILQLQLFSTLSNIALHDFKYLSS